MSENDGFTSGGREKFPSIYQDEQQVGEFSTWPDNALHRLFEEYSEFVKRDDLMPRATASADRILLHLSFEIAWRRGFFDADNSVD